MSPTLPAEPAPSKATENTPASAGDSTRAARNPTSDSETGSGNGSGDTPGSDAASDAAKKRRRRGSRGGRNRKKPNRPNASLAAEPGRPARSAPAARGAGPDADDEGDDERTGHGEDWTDADADRGFTNDDVAAEALEDAGLQAPPATPRAAATRPAPPGRPRIGDSRPARAASEELEEVSDNGDSSPAKKRRRRRGGRGRSKGGGGSGGGGGGGNNAAAQYIAAGSLLDVDVDGTTILETLDELTLEKRRGVHRKGRPAGRYLMVVHQRGDGISQIAVLEGRSLVEHYVSHQQDETTSIDGNIYLGRVQNVLPGMEAAFIDIGTPKNGVLYRGDVLYDERDLEGGEKPRIERALHGGQSITVQVTKNPIGHKGARLTQEVSLAGRFVVMVPGQPQTYGISKRLPDDERRRLRRVLDRVRPSEAGLIVRTAAEGATEDELERDLRRLEGQWRQISELAKRAKPGSLLYKEPELAIRIIREEFTKEYRGIVIDDPALYEEVRSYVDAVSPELTERVEYYDAAAENLPVFERFHVHEQLHKALDRKVWLPSGGSIIIERTEALTVIDVNTGKNVGSSNLEETVYRNNLEAADAIARELRLRDIGGIIVIDFIDMEIKSNREAVEEGFRQALARDKTRTQVFSISELGLLEMTRKRVSEGLVEAFSSTCPECGGRGFIVDQTMLD
ncbi:MAG: ribonuclease [Actinomycetia bacterium]|nr:ribonuclease [Actinomycetes bacterium]